MPYERLCHEAKHLFRKPDDRPPFQWDRTRPPPPSWQSQFLLTILFTSLLCRLHPIAKRTTLDDDEWAAVPMSARIFYPWAIPAVVYCVFAPYLRCPGTQYRSCGRYCPEWGSIVLRENDAEPSVRCFSCSWSGLKQPSDAAFERFEDVAGCEGQFSANLAQVPAATKVGTLSVQHRALRVAADEAVADAAVRVAEALDVPETATGVKARPGGPKTC